MLHIALLDASLGTPHAKRNFQREIDATLTVFDVNKGELPPPINSDNVLRQTGISDPFDAAVISGSQSSVYHDEAWIARLSTWVRSAIASGLPIFGVCWGHQLLAEVLGGRVEGGAYELGYTEVEQFHSDPFFEGVENPCTVFATHSDHVVEMPPEATVLARNEASIQSFRHENVFTTQFHPEYDLRTAKAMIESKDLPATDIQQALATCTAENVRKAQDVKRVFDNFLSYVAGVSDRAPIANDPPTAERPSQP
ncbi:MAG: type 1 glutamine amidotransferase [Bacteroidetes bacterium]|jgi:GMP synthase (glutamine-hydrolysing)|nr:type 1 glutamine amidotransferase [Bacteroidota bacterium]